MRPTVLPIVLLFALGCSTGSVASDPAVAPSFEPLRIAPDPSGRDPSECVKEDESGVRAPTDVFERDAFVRLVSMLPHDEAVVVSVATDSAGLPTRLRVVEATLPQDVAGGFRDSLALYFRPAGDPATRSVNMRIRIDGAANPRVRTASTWACFPELSNEEEVRDLLTRAATRAERPGRSLLWIRVLEDGSAGEVRLSESSGDPFTDALAIGVATQMEFLPAIRDRFPIAVWVEMPISITIR